MLQLPGNEARFRCSLVRS